MIWSFSPLKLPQLQLTSVISHKTTIQIASSHQCLYNPRFSSKTVPLASITLSSPASKTTFNTLMTFNDREKDKDEVNYYPTAHKIWEGWCACTTSSVGSLQTSRYYLCSMFHCPLLNILPIGSAQDHPNNIPIAFLIGVHPFLNTTASYQIHKKVLHSFPCPVVILYFFICSYSCICTTLFLTLITFSTLSDTSDSIFPSNT